ncbi:hypothetical protein DH2020_015488 [Rehmannia glutinosa]|uniref:Kinesin motor domain-containing protein n=1 Tax=Rehmannia glutinosa TaxID=99300 RepID=A0ABR0WVG2_REHGL
MESGEEFMSGNEERIYVSVRLRPLNGKEILRNDVSDWECINDKTIVYKNVGLSASERSMYPTAYTFASVFAYGQTSSGKTYTMTGITEYAIADIYQYIQKHPEREFVLKFSAMEIYNESVRDLLSVDSTPLRLLDDPERGTTVEKLTEEILKDWNHVIHLLSICEAQRQIGETSLNEMSSRSHQIIRLTIESSSREFLGRDNASTLAATVNFVDLAGSERASQSLSAGTRLKEGCHINRSLLTLGTVIRKLSKSRSGHIPYRDSKLTRILQTSLGGNAKTAIICTMSPARSHVEQSRNTLLFASCAKEVTTNARVNVVMSDKALLEEEINDLILQRDIAQSQVKDLLQMLGDDANSMTRVGLGDYPHLRVQKSPDNETRRQETSILADPHSLDVDTRTCSDGHSRTSSEDHIVKEIEKQSSGTSEDLCREVRCIEAEESSEKRAKESNHLCSEENSSMPEVEVYVNGNVRDLESPLTPLKNDSEMKDDIVSHVVSSNGDQEKELLLHPLYSSVARSLKFSKSRSCKASIADLGSPWFKTIDFSENASSFGSERESVGFERKLSPLSFNTDMQSLSRKDSQSSPRNALDIEIDSPNVKFATDDDDSNENDPKVDESPKKNVKDVGLDPIEDEPKDPSSWPAEFKRLQQEIIELWHACNVSLVHRTYFFMLFQGDPSDAIYLEVEMRRMKFLKHKFSQGDKTTVNGKCLTLSSRYDCTVLPKFWFQYRQGSSRGETYAEPADDEEAFEQERQSLFLKWGIGLNTKLRRLQLAHRLWTKTDDMDHIADSAFLVAKLVGTVEPGQTHNKEIRYWKDIESRKLKMDQTTRYGAVHEIKPMLLMILCQVASGGVNIFYKLAVADGMTIKILVVYRLIFATIFIAPIALFFERPALASNLYAESLVLTSATFAAAMANLNPALTLILSLIFRLERLDMRRSTGKAKVLGTLLGIGGAMVLTIYKGSWLVLQGIIGSAMAIAIAAWGTYVRGPLYVSCFSPLALIFVAVLGSLIIDEKLHLGSIIGSVLIIMGLYMVLWGKAKEMKMDESGSKTTGNGTLEMIADHRGDETSTSAEQV